MYMALSSKFFPESTSEKIVKIGLYLAKIWKKYNCLLFGLPYRQKITDRFANSNLLIIRNELPDLRLTATAQLAGCVCFCVNLARICCLFCV